MNINKKPDEAVVLSIGMIVKNEERHLDNCLSALKKLMDNISCELIIVDTGSTDRTKEIALKYTDKVYDFEWINDFSAARNYGLEKAVGKWFMFIDADEYLGENHKEMVDFFNLPELYNKYMSASYVIQNYVRGSQKPSSQFLAPRLVRITEDTKFHDPIHEWLPQHPPYGYFNTVFHHYGYVYMSKAEKEKKDKRNYEPMLKEYEKNPTDLRVLYNLCNAVYNENYFKSEEEKERFLGEYLAEARKRIDSPYASNGYMKNVGYLLVNNKFDKAIELLNELIGIEVLKKSVIMVEAYFYLARAYLNQENYKKTFEAIKGYLGYLQEYKDNKLELVEMRYGIVQGLTEYDYEEMVLNGAMALGSLERFDEAIAYLERVSLSDMNFAHIKLYLTAVDNLAEKSHNYDYMVGAYNKICQLNNADKIGLAIASFEGYYMNHPREREQFVKEFAEHGEGRYADLMRLVREHSNGADISASLSEFISETPSWDNGYSEAIYLAMKMNVDITVAMDKMSYDLIKKVIGTISDGHTYDYSETALGYFENIDYGASIKSMLWCVLALEEAVHKSNELDDDRKGVLYDLFVTALSDYIFNIYNPDLLNPDDIDVLPELHRFGYFITLAFTAKSDNDTLGYVRGLKEALKQCEPMKELVSFYLNEFEKEMKN